MATLEERARLLLSAKADQKVQKACLEMCKKDPLFWFDNFAYTFNPRVKPAELPFNLYLFQEKVIQEMASCIQDGTSLVIEKSRDMGATWMVMLLFQYFWIFHPGMDFLVGSKKEKDVDERGSKSTLIEKCRFNWRYQPEWMISPPGKTHDGHMKLVNPDNGNVIIGDTATADFGRGQRYRAALLDEFAVHPFGRQAKESVDHTTDCVIMLWTPYGKANEAYRLRQQADIDWVEVNA